MEFDVGGPCRVDESERLIRSIRRECLDKMILVGEAHRRHVVTEVLHPCNQDSPHPGIGSRRVGETDDPPGQDGAGPLPPEAGRAAHQLLPGGDVRAWAWTLLLVLLAPGCIFSERSYPFDPRTRVVIDPPAETAQERPTARQWLAQVSPQLGRLLPAHRKTALITDQLVTPEGRAADVVAHFEIKTDQLESIFVNFLGLAYSAQAIMRRGPPTPAPPWEGFEDVWIPVREDLQLAGRLGWARDTLGRVTDADCIVILPGIRGDNNILRVRDLALALHQGGFHVLNVELRGTGSTDRRFPKYEYTWGIFETDDLLIVADWLQGKPHVRRTGLVAYSWGANQAILAAWAEGRIDDEGVPPRLRQLFTPPPQGPRRFQAGVLAFSPIVRFEELIDKLEVEHAAWLHPALAGIQTTVRDRMIEKHDPHPCGSVRELIKHMGVVYDEEVADGLEYVRLLPYKGLPAHDRLNGVRMPLLIVHAADDMVAPAQDLADLLATVHNPDVAAILLPSGGHIGFGPYASAWYYNLILNYFDPSVGVAAGRGAASTGDEPVRRERLGGPSPGRVRVTQKTPP